MDEAGERGDAVIEWCGIAAVILVPLVALIVSCAAVQQGALAVASAAREAERILSVDAGGADAAEEVARVILRDAGVSPRGRILAVSCEGACRPGALAEVEASVDVDLPIVPAFVRGLIPPVRVSARGVALLGEEVVR